MAEEATQDKEAAHSEESLEEMAEPIEPKAELEAEAAEVEFGIDEEAPKPRRTFLRKALRWVTAFIAIFGAGVILTFVTRVQPVAQQLEDLQVEYQTLLAEVEELRPIAEQVHSLTEELLDARNRQALLNVLVDVTQAQLHMAEDDAIAAKAALAGTDQRLAELQKGLSGNDAGTVSALRERLHLAIAEVETDAFAAQRDLEIMANNLLTFERALFGE